MIHYMNEAGRHHNCDNSINQDAVMSGSSGDYSVIALADGVSTCLRSREGAMCTCRAVTELLLTEGMRLMDMTGEELSRVIAERILADISRLAEAEHIDVTEYSSTAACALMERSTGRMMYFSLGDSLILGTGADGCRVIAMPSDSRRGCCVTTTRNPSSHAKAGVMDAGELRSVVICSDGAWRLMYRRNRLIPEIRELLTGQEHEELREVLMAKERFDDCSFISADLRGGAYNE